MNELTVRKTACDLAQQNLGPVDFGTETKTSPKFPLKGMLWEYHRRPFFSMIGTWTLYFFKQRVPS